MYDVRLQYTFRTLYTLPLFRANSSSTEFHRKKKNQEESLNHGYVLLQKCHSNMTEPCISKSAKCTNISVNTKYCCNQSTGQDASNF